MIPSCFESPLLFPTFFMLALVGPGGMPGKRINTDTNVPLLTGIGLDENEIVQSFSDEEAKHSFMLVSVTGPVSK